MTLFAVLQAQSDLQKAGVDALRCDNEVEREIGNFEQTKLRDIKVFSVTIMQYTTYLYFNTGLFCLNNFTAQGRHYSLQCRHSSIQAVWCAGAMLICSTPRSNESWTSMRRYGQVVVAATSTTPIG